MTTTNLSSSRIRIRIAFEDGIEDLVQATEGFAQCWYLIPPKLRYIGDLLHRLVSDFNLEDGFIHGFRMCLDGYGLPSSQSINLLRDGDTVTIHQSQVSKTDDKIDPRMWAKKAKREKKRTKKKKKIQRDEEAIDLYSNFTTFNQLTDRREEDNKSSEQVRPKVLQKEEDKSPKRKHDHLESEILMEHANPTQSPINDHTLNNYSEQINTCENTKRKRKRKRRRKNPHNMDDIPSNIGDIESRQILTRETEKIMLSNDKRINLKITENPTKAGHFRFHDEVISSKDVSDINICNKNNIRDPQVNNSKISEGKRNESDYSTQPMNTPHSNKLADRGPRELSIEGPKDPVNQDNNWSISADYARPYEVITHIEWTSKVSECKTFNQFSTLNDLSDVDRGMLIAFKILQLCEDTWQPVLTSYKVGLIESVESEHVNINPYSDIQTSDGRWVPEENASLLCYEWNSLVEPRLIQQCCTN